MTRKPATVYCSKSTRLAPLRSQSRRKTAVYLIVIFENLNNQSDLSLFSSVCRSPSLSSRCKLAQSSGWGVMVSHRSGETEDTFISDLVVGLCTGQVHKQADGQITTPQGLEQLQNKNDFVVIILSNVTVLLRLRLAPPAGQSVWQSTTS